MKPQDSLMMGRVALGTTPRIIAVLDTFFSDQELQTIHAEGASIVEIRFDLLPGSFQEHLAFAERVRRLNLFAILGTLRETEENKRVRNEQIDAILPFIDGLDEEVAYSSAAANLKKVGNRIKIASHHDYKETPNDDTLSLWADRCDAAGADIIKLACTVRSASDVERLKQFGADAPVPMILIAMGDLGKESRLNPSQFHSLATYAFCGKNAVAPGQFHVRDIAQALRTHGH